MTRSSANNQPPRRNLPAEASPGPVFRVGLSTLSVESIEAGKRFFRWTMNPGDLAVADLAGWQDMPFEGSGTMGRLEIPMSARSASSALAGAEAWLGEKDQILGAMAGYAKAVHDRYGIVDTNLQLDSVAVMRGNERIFMVPPHNLAETGASIKGEWYDQLYADIDSVLVTDPRREELLGNFDVAMSFMREQQ